MTSTQEKYLYIDYIFCQKFGTLQEAIFNEDLDALCEYGFSSSKEAEVIAKTVKYNSSYLLASFKLNLAWHNLKKVFANNLRGIIK